jgi:hypothetical protein
MRALNILQNHPADTAFFLFSFFGVTISVPKPDSSRSGPDGFFYFLLLRPPLEIKAVRAQKVNLRPSPAEINMRSMLGKSMMAKIYIVP